MAPDDAVPDATPLEGEAARAVFERFTRRLIGLARAQLDARLHPEIDPEDVVQSADQLLGELDEDERPIIELSLQGYTTQEISELLGRAERSVRRLRERVRAQLERVRAEVG